MSSFKFIAYNKSIDGLRAIAVLAVFFFHLGIPFFSGGYVGVDIFFVISGYLISYQIIKRIQTNAFNLYHFLAKRFMRLYPALIITLCLSCFFAFLLFSPTDFSNFSDYAMHSLTSTSNIFYYHHSGYFDEQSKYNPLLHTWSLSVEWQFYLIWPCLLFAIKSFRQKYQVLTLLLIFSISLCYSQYLTSTNANAAYYLLPSRFFELTLGSLLVYVKKPTNSIYAGLLYGTGLILIFIAILLYKSSLPFPGILALVPCLGVLMCLYFDTPQTLITKLIGNFHHLGKISYSMYLMHWPVIIFYSYAKFSDVPELTFADDGSIFLITLILSYSLHRFIEEKFRALALFSMPSAPIIPLIILLAFGCYGIKTHDGFPWRVEPAKLAQIKNPVDFHNQNYGGVNYPLETTLGNKDKQNYDAAIIGDSYALQLSLGIDEKIGDKKIYGVFQHGCIFGPGITRILDGKSRQDCHDKYLKLVKTVNTNKIPSVLYAISYAGYVNQTGDLHDHIIPFTDNAAFTNFLVGNIKKIQQDIPNSKIIIIGHGPGVGNLKIDSCLLRPKYIKSACESKLNLDPKYGNAYQILQLLEKEIAALDNVEFIDGYKVFCNRNKCLPIIENQVMYSDTFHLSKNGSVYFINSLKNELLTKLA